MIQQVNLTGFVWWPKLHHSRHLGAGLATGSGERGYKLSAAGEPRKWCCEKQGCWVFKVWRCGLKTCFFPSRIEIAKHFALETGAENVSRGFVFWWNGLLMWPLILCGKASLSWIPWDLHHIWSHFVSGGPFFRLKKLWIFTIRTTLDHLFQCSSNGFCLEGHESQMAREPITDEQVPYLLDGRKSRSLKPKRGEPSKFMG